jgi:hypothetical protein
MDEFEFHLQKLPDFIRTEVTLLVGKLSRLSSLEIVSRYLELSDYLIGSKLNGIPQKNIDKATRLWGHTPCSKEQLERMLPMHVLPEHGEADDDIITVNANFYLQSVRFLKVFREGLGGLVPRLQQEQHQFARRVIEEAEQALAQCR